MSASFQISSFAPSPVAVSPARAIRASFASVVAFIDAAFARTANPREVERHARDVDIVSVSRWDGYGRDGIGWNDIGYRI